MLHTTAVEDMDRNAPTNIPSVGFPPHNWKKQAVVPIKLISVTISQEEKESVWLARVIMKITLFIQKPHYCSDSKFNSK